VINNNKSVLDDSTLFNSMSISTSIYNNNYPKNQNLYYQSQSIDRIMEYLDKNINVNNKNTNCDYSTSHFNSNNII